MLVIGVPVPTIGAPGFQRMVVARYSVPAGVVVDVLKGMALAVVRNAAPPATRTDSAMTHQRRRRALK
jgi:hypothetical protein